MCPNSQFSLHLYLFYIKKTNLFILFATSFYIHNLSPACWHLPVTSNSISNILTGRPRKQFHFKLFSIELSVYQHFAKCVCVYVNLYIIASICWFKVFVCLLSFLFFFVFHFFLFLQINILHVDYVSFSKHVKGILVLP